MENLYSKAPLQPAPLRVSSVPIRVGEMAAPHPAIKRQLNELDRHARSLHRYNYLAATLTRPTLVTR